MRVFSFSLVALVVVVAALGVDARRLDSSSQLLRQLVDRARQRSNLTLSSSARKAALPRESAVFMQNPSEQLRVLDTDPVSCPGTATTVALDVPPRKMWGWGGSLSGYCGETSFQCSIMLYGGWVSAELVRYADGNEELLVGVNDETTAKTLKLDYEVYDGYRATADQYLQNFVKRNIDAGAVSILGFYEQQPRGDNEYDHIMPIFGYDADASGKVVGIYYNDLWSPASRHLCRYTSGTTVNPKFVSGRKGCQQSAEPSQPFDYCIPSGTQYSISVKGLSGISGAPGVNTLVKVSDWWEPDWGKEDGLHQTPVELGFSLVLSGLQTGQPYTVLRFDSETALHDGPTPQQSSYVWKYSFSATTTNGTQWLPNVASLMSDGKYYFVTVAGTV